MRQKIRKKNQTPKHRAVTSRLSLWAAGGFDPTQGQTGDLVEHIAELSHLKGEEGILIVWNSSLKGCWLFSEHELPQQTEQTPVGRGSSQADSCRDEEAHSPPGW